MLMASISVNISVLPERLYKISGPAGTDAYYSGKKVLGTGANNYFVANQTTSIIVDTVSPSSGAITITEIQRSYHNAYDGQGGVWVYQPIVDKWTSSYSFRPEWISMVGNRLVTFKSGMPYVHSSSVYNTFYGQAYDSALAFVHNEATNSTKAYTALSIEGDTPDLVHIRTEVPNVQSTDLRTSDFEVKEGVKYAPILRDRLSPNNTGTYDQKLYKGDRIRGEIGLFQGVFSTPSTSKLWKFVNIGFIPSRGHSTVNE
jgi:hypothetical protein